MASGWDFSSLDGPADSSSGWDFSSLDGGTRPEPEEGPSPLMGLFRKLYPVTALKDAYDASGPILGAGGRASDWLLGAGARGVAGIEQRLLDMTASDEERADPRGQAAFAAVEALRKKGEELQAGTTDYGSALAEEIPRPEGGALGHLAGAARGAVRLGGNVARDPLTYLALGKIAQVPTWLKAAAAGLFTAQGAEGTLEAGKRAWEHRGTPEGTEALTEALGAGYFTKKGAEHGVAETARALGEFLPKTGRIYELDPNASPAEVAARRAEIAAEDAARAQQEAAGVGQISRAAKRLLFERSRALKPVKGAPVAPEPEAGTPTAKALEAAERRAYEALATPTKAGKPAAIPRVEDLGRARDAAGKLVERQGPVGQPDLTPRQAKMVRRRLLQLWAEEGGPQPVERAPIAGRGLEKLVAPKPQTLGERIERALHAGATRFVRAVEPSFDAVAHIPGVGPEIAGRLRAMTQEAEVRLGKVSAETKRALQEAMGLRRPLAPADLIEGPSPIREWLLKQDAEQKLLPVDELPEALRGPAEALRAVRLEQRQRGIELGQIDPNEPFVLWSKKPTPEVAPRFTQEAKVLDLANRLAKSRGREQPTEQDLGDARQQIAEPGSELVGGTRKGRQPGSLYKIMEGEAGLQPGEFRTDWGAFLESLREVELKLAEVKHLGPEGKTVRGLINRIPDDKSKFGDKAFANKLVDRVREVETQTAAHVASSYVRGFQAAVGLVKSPVTQLSTVGNTASEVGTINTLKAISDTFLKQPTGPDGKPMKWNRPVKRLRAALNEARLSAEQVGALMAGQMENVQDFYTRTRTEQAPGQASAEGAFSKGVARLPHLRGTGWTDTLQRVWAAGTAKYAVPEQWAKAKAGDATAQRQLDRWHVDWRREALSPEMIDTAAKRISDLTQFKVGTGELPLWASSPLGKVAFQFQSFGYAHTRLMGHAVDEGLRRGNWLPLARLASIGAAAGYATNEAKRLIFGGQEPENPTEEDFKVALTNAFQGKRHYEPGSPEGAVLAAVEGLGAAGGIGALGSLYERVASGSPTKLALGATGADVEALERLAAAAATRKDIEKPALSLAAGLAPTGPLGLNPREALRELASKKPIPNPGYAGRIMDAAGVGPGAEARATQGELERNAAATKRERDALAKMTTPKPESPSADRLKESRRERIRAELMRELVDAIRTGNKAREMSVYRRAAEAGLGTDFVRAAMKTRGRVVFAPEVNP